jgi:uncharacterized RDD family membrane protein YckC
VDLVLQMIDGLEAAHAAGVLHRDIKPANCFLTPEGVVKVGDFGLSISTLARAEEQLTATGTVLGTPAFASPEQLRGREVDVRSDLYAVGATLYFLLTGRPTHADDALVSLIAAVLEEVPATPVALRADVPRGLSSVVMRCLEKAPEARYGSYKELRQALFPFSSHGVTAATVGLRTVAGWVDFLILVAFTLTLLLLPGDAESALTERSLEAFVATLVAAFIHMLYYAGPEALWGCTLGKAICGLRVVRRDGSLPGFGRALWRAFLFTLPFHVHTALGLLVYTGAEAERISETGEVTWVDATLPVLMLLLFVTIRQRNGFAAIHDLLSDTRVIATDKVTALTGFALPSKPAPAVGTERIGPFATVERLPGLTVAWDDVLRRFVWITNGAAGTTARHDIARAGRLRWVAGGRTEGESWDAFEAVDGLPLTALLDQQQPWTRVRSWLLQLGEELSASLRDGQLPPVSFDRIWITRSGRAVLLDFPAPRATPMQSCEVNDDTSAQRFLSDLAHRALPAVMPLHARDFLDSLAASRLEALPIVVANLRTLMARPAVFPRARRVFTIAMPVVLSLMLGGLIALGLGSTNEVFDEMWEREYPGRPSLRLVLESLGTSPTLSPDSFHRTMRHIATEYEDVIRDPEFWKRPETNAGISPDFRRFAKIAVEHLADGAATVSEKDAELMISQLHRHAQKEAGMLKTMVPTVTLTFLGLFLGLGGLWAVVKRAPLGLDLMGAALVTNDGRRASWMRAIARSLLVVIPALALTFGVNGESTAHTVLTWTSLSLLLVGGISAIRRPERALPDVIAGTWIVPR